MNGTELCSFTASLNGQIGKARLTTEGVVFVAAGGVHTAVELRCSDMIKFKVTPEKNPKAILRFELAPPEKPFMLQVCLTEDQRCGMNEAEARAQERVVLEEVRAHVTNQKHWACNAAPGPAASSSSSSSSKVGPAAPAGGWGRSLAGTAPLGQSNVSASKGSGGGVSSAPAPKKRRVNGGQAAASRAAEAAAAELALEESCREALLDADPALKRQYLEAVVTGAVVTEAEFWESRRALVAREAAARQGREEGLEAFWWRKAREGQDLAATAGGAAGRPSKSVKMTLRAEDVHQLFALYPAVKQLYAQKVPHEVPADQFWAAFFKSEFLSLGRAGSSGSGSAPGGRGASSPEGLEGGLFAAVGNADQSAKRSALELHALAAATDPSVDLVAAYGDYVNDAVDVYEPVVATQLDLPSEADKREAQERSFTINAYNKHGERLLQRGPDPLGRAVRDAQADLEALRSPTDHLGRPPLVLGVESLALREARAAAVRAHASGLSGLLAPPPPSTQALVGLSSAAHRPTAAPADEAAVPTLAAVPGSWSLAPTMLRVPHLSAKPHALSGGLVVPVPGPPGAGAAAAKSFRAALDATDPGGGPSGEAAADAAAAGGAACLVEARKKAQRSHELLRHFYALATSAQAARRAQGASVGLAAAAAALGPQEAAKLLKLEARMEVVLEEVRAETRIRAEEATAHHQRAASEAQQQCLQAGFQLRALEKQLEKAFACLSALRGEEAGRGAGGFVAVQDSPRKGGRR